MLITTTTSIRYATRNNCPVDYGPYRRYNSCKRNTALAISTPNSPLHIRLPLYKPQPKSLPIPIKKPTAALISDVLRLMDGLSLPVPADMYVSLIKECTESRNASQAIELHAHINRSGRRPGLALLNRLLLMYVSCGCVDTARQVFDKMSVRSSVSWAAMLAGYMDNGLYEEAISLFVEMQSRCRYRYDDEVFKFPVSWILVCILKACICTMNLRIGKEIHGWLLKAGYSMGLFLSSSLINFYGKMSCLEGVDFVFDQVSRPNTVVWTARIVSNCKQEHYCKVLDVFKEMGKQGAKKNSFTFSSVLRACGKLSDGGYCGQQVHADAIKLGLDLKSYVQCGLVDMYGKCGLLEDAKMVFEMSRDRRNEACWNAMLTCCIQHGLCIEAIKILYEMRAAGLQPHESLANEVWLVCGSRSFEDSN